MNKVDLAYLAGLVDGEAYIGIKKTKAYRCQGRQTPGYTPRIQVRMVDEPAIKFLAETLGGWYYREKPRSANGRPLFCFQASDKKAVTILRALLPYLRVKRKQAETALELASIKLDAPKHRTKITGYRNFPNANGTPRKVANKSLSDEFVNRCDDLWMECKRLNAVGI